MMTDRAFNAFVGACDMLVSWALAHPHRFAFVYSAVIGAVVAMALKGYIA